MELIQWKELAPIYTSQSKIVPGDVGKPARTHYVPDPIKCRISYEWPFNLEAQPDPSKDQDQFPSPPKKVFVPLVNPITGKSTPPYKAKNSGGGGGSPNGPGLGVASWLPPDHPKALGKIY
jgi:hypothetical protein